MNEDIGFYIKKLDNCAKKLSYAFYDREAAMGYSLTNLRVADFLYDRRDEDVFQKDIEEEFLINRATASKMLGLMEEKGLILRLAGGPDGRYKRLVLTAEGEKLREVYRSMRDAMEARLTAPLSAEEQEQFRVLCRKILGGFQNF